jgi:hypothetical protein
MSSITALSEYKESSTPKYFWIGEDEEEFMKCFIHVTAVCMYSET